jgi:hypothetical protein
VERPIEECKQSQHTAEADYFRHSQELSRRSHGQGEDYKDKRPITSLVRDVLDGIGGQVVVQRTPGQLAQGHQAQYENRQFHPFPAEKAPQGLALSV